MSAFLSRLAGISALDTNVTYTLLSFSQQLSQTGTEALFCYLKYLLVVLKLM